MERTFSVIKKKRKEIVLLNLWALPLPVLIGSTITADYIPGLGSHETKKYGAAKQQSIKSNYHFSLRILSVRNNNL